MPRSKVLTPPSAVRVFLSLVVVLSVVPFLRPLNADIGRFVTTVQQVIPGEARPGDMVTATGYALDAEHLKELYLTKGDNDFQVEIVEQNDRSVRFKVPAKIPTGVTRLAIVVAGRNDILEEPVFLKILPTLGE